MIFLFFSFFFWKDNFYSDSNGKKKKNRKCMWMAKKGTDVWIVTVSSDLPTVPMENHLKR